MAWSIPSTEAFRILWGQAYRPSPREQWATESLSKHLGDSETNQVRTRAMPVNHSLEIVPVDDRQITHLICVRLKHLLYDFGGGVLGLLPVVSLI